MVLVLILETEILLELVGPVESVVLSLVDPGVLSAAVLISVTERSVNEATLSVCAGSQLTTSETCRLAVSNCNFSSK